LQNLITTWPLILFNIATGISFSEVLRFRTNGSTVLICILPTWLTLCTYNVILLPISNVVGICTHFNKLLLGW
jgi:hypothetical protein